MYDSGKLEIQGKTEDRENFARKLKEYTGREKEKKKKNMKRQ